MTHNKIISLILHIYILNIIHISFYIYYVLCFLAFIYFIILLRNKKWPYCHIILKSMAATM